VTRGSRARSGLARGSIGTSELVSPATVGPLQPCMESRLALVADRTFDGRPTRMLLPPNAEVALSPPIAVAAGQAARADASQTIASQHIA